MSIYRRAAFAAALLIVWSAQSHAQVRRPVRAPASPAEKIAIPFIVFETPTVQCGSGGVSLTVSSSNGQTNYQPQPDQCIRITTANGTLVPGSPASGFPYTTPQFTTPLLALTPGAAHTLEIAYCSSGGHAYPPSQSMPNPFPYGNFSFTAPNCRKGMTWSKYGSDPVSGVVRVGCHASSTSSAVCDAYAGDTACTVPLPVLCKKVLALPKPMSYPNNARWSGNIVATSPPVSPSTAGLSTRAAVDAYCAAQFGAGWKVAAFHDNTSGWNFSAYGNVGTQSPRFWVDIADQPAANCWLP